MPNFRSLVPGGAFGDGTTGPVAFRANNPGAINGAPWERQWPGYLYDKKYDGVNNTTVFETPEQGVAVWMELLRRYRRMNLVTIEDIIVYYGGGQANYKREYEPTVVRWTGLSPDTEIKIDGSDDATLLKFAKAIFAYEVGMHPPCPLPWSDAQIKYGFALFRHENPAPLATNEDTKPKPPASPGWFKLLWDFLNNPVFRKK